MRKHLLLIIALCLHLAARGQTVPDAIDLSWLPQATQAKALRYWIDDDTGSMQTSDILNGRYTVDASSLIEGLHTIHFQIIDSDEKVAAPYSCIFLKMVSHPSVSEASTLRYWFDDGTNVTTCNANVGTQLLDASALLDGLHTLHYQVVDTEGNVSYVASGIFLKMQSGLSSSEASTLRYWLDDDTNVSTCNANVGTQLLDASALLDGLHTLHYQVVDTEGNASYVASGIFLKMGKMAETGVVTAKKLIYWFDDEQTTTTLDMLSGIMSLDASNLLDGLHTVHYMVVCSDGSITSAHSSIFLRMDVDIQSTTAHNFRYWFDDETNVTVTEIAQGTQILDASHLLDGLHTVHYQIVDENGDVASPYSSIFLKMEKIGAATTTARSLRYWFDSEATITTIEIAQGTQMLDASYLLDGLHTVHYQIVDNSGAVTSPYSSVFLKMAERDETLITAQSLRYWFDDDKEVKTTSVAGGTQIIDVTNLLAGLHTLHYQLVDGNGDVSTPMSRIFIKNFDKAITDGDNRITKYQYWLNMNSEAMQTVELDAAANPYTLIALLPLQKEPIQSSQFHFEVTNNVPTIYAKNTLHVRFYDAQNYFSDGQKQFVDYSMKQEVEPVGELQATQTFDKVAENDIRWYTMQVAPGDTTAFRVSQAATVQVFSPSGKEVFNTSGSASVNWSGIHTWEDGTYYVAVHDVTGSRNTMTLDYMHMDKYDVVDWDVHTVGNGGCSTITFKGNGFCDLYAVDLYTAAGDSIHSVDISHESDAETAVTFDFSGAELGVYDAVFHFTQEDKRFANIVTVEEAVDIELATNVSFPSSFLRGTSTTYTIKITNKGNMTAYNVPIYTYIMNKNKEDGISHIKFEGLGLRGLFDAIDIDSISAAEKQEIEELIEKIGDSHYFQHFRVKDENSQGDSIWVKCGYFFTNIAPHEIKTLRLVVTASEEVIAYISVPEDWSVFSKTKENFLSRALAPSKRANLKDKFCCYHEKIECYLDITSLVADIVELVAIGVAPFTEGATLTVAAKAKWIGCATSSLSSLSTVSATLFCDTDKSFMEKLKEQGTMNTLSVLATVLSCQPEEIKALKIGAKFIKETLKNWKSLLKGGIKWGDNASGFFQCRSNPQNDSNCPPDPPGGGSSIPYTPVDPNDIYGYLSDAGSKFMTDEVAKVNYTIEFENDTAFAQASAHTIVIRDTLDSRYFDLKSFLPTSVKIGEREAFLDEATDIKTSGSVTSFLKTIDMRPEINAIAQVEGEYRQQTGIAKWTFTSLDPMTMEPTDDLMQGILPVNYNGTSGIGEVMFEVGVKPNKGDGTQIPNRASIVFDYEEPILTPTWTNIVDATAPESHIANVQMATDSTATVRIEATDELSGPWRYDVYVQYGSGAWFKAAENVPIDTTASVKVYEGINHGFYVVVTDSAGNVEQKNAEREFTFEVFGSQIDTDTRIELAEGWNWMSHNQEEPLMVAELQSAGSRMLGQTEELYEDARFGWMGDLEELLPTQMYKLQMDGPLTVQLSGRLFNAGFRAVPLYEGWNWMGYPVARTMTPAEALAKLEAEEGDMLIGQDGMATYSDGQWTGTLMEMNPGQGYMFRSQSNKNLFLNATAQASSRRANSPRRSSLPDDWTVNKRKYPNVMGMIAQLWHDDALADSGEWQLGAFCGDECRGVAQTVGDGEPTQTVLMMNVYGTGSEPISFRVMNRETGEVLDAAEQESFRADVIGSMQQPYALHIGEKTGVRYVTNDTQQTQQATYDLQGRRVEAGQAAKGIYVVADGKKNKTQKVVKR